MKIVKKQPRHTNFMFLILLSQVFFDLNKGMYPDHSRKERIRDDYRIQKEKRGHDNRLRKRGLKEFRFGKNGEYTVLALNRKNAIRKAKLRGYI